MEKTDEWQESGICNGGRTDGDLPGNLQTLIAISMVLKHNGLYENMKRKEDSRERWCCECFRS